MNNHEAAIRAARKRLIESELYDVKVYEEGGGPIGQGHSRLADLETVADVRPDDEEKYTPEWARETLGNEVGSLYIVWYLDCASILTADDLWLRCDRLTTSTRGAARRLVAAIRECFGGERT